MNAAIARHASFVPHPSLGTPLPYRDPEETEGWSPAGSRRASDGAVPLADGPAEPDVKAALARILASMAFRHSARHRAFLRYIVLNTLAGQTRALKEVVIGLDVFERTLDRFDPRRDSIVRVEARRLRKKLRAYYDGEGRHEALEIRLDVGGYVPCFLARTPAREERTARPMIMVVPFIASDDTAARIVAAGLGDRLTDTLGAIDGLRVMATFSPSRTRPAADGPDAIVVPGAADYVIDGSVIGVESRWRCIAHLTSMHDGIRCWSRTFDAGAEAAAGDPFALQDRIAAALCEAVRIELRRGD